jgi:outer membrane protein insertion porin family
VSPAASLLVTEKTIMASGASNDRQDPKQPALRLFHGVAAVLPAPVSENARLAIGSPPRCELYGRRPNNTSHSNTIGHVPAAGRGLRSFNHWPMGVWMHGRVRAAVLLTLLLGWLAIGGAGAAAADDPDTIAVAGNRQVGADAIRSYFRTGAAGRHGAEALDAALKSLYATGLFQDVKVSREGDRVLVTVVENPTIERLAFEGNKKVKDADLKKLLQSKENGPLWRAFVQSDVVQIIALYRQQGYFDVKVEPQTIKTKHDRVNLIFAITEGGKLAVKKILFVGNKAFPQNKLSGVIKSGKTNILSFLLNNDTYDADRIENDRDLLRQFYLAHGYAEVRVSSSASYEANQKGVVLTFTLDEGSQYRFGKVDIESSLKTVDAAALGGYLRTRAGDTYDADAVNRTVDDLSMQLARSGEPFASVFARSDRLPDRRLINLTYAIDPGKRLYVERIDIHGNARTHDDVIRREFDFGEGDAYNRALVDRAERRLKALGYFKTVKSTTQPGSAPDHVVLNVTVEEQDTGNFSIAGGYSTADGVLAEVRVSDTNLLGTGYKANTTVTYGQYARGLELGFTDPYFLDQRLSAGVDLFGKETFANSYQSYNSTIYGAKFLLGTPLNENLGVTWNYSIYNQGLSLNPASGIASLPIQQAAQAGAIWVSSVGSSVTYSTLDDPRNPTSGVRAQTNNDFAGLGGAAKFARTTEDVRYYHPIVGDVVGMVRAQGGYVAPWGGQQLPLLDNFFGGPQLVRGFAPNGFGPRDITPGTTQDNVGGNVYWTTSAELQAPMPLVPADANLKVALFSDVGSLWANGASSTSSLASLSPSQQIANSKALRASLGGSLIWDSPFGALRVDYAYPIAKQPYDVTQRLNFTAGAF